MLGRGFNPFRVILSGSSSAKGVALCYTTAPNLTENQHVTKYLFWPLSSLRPDSVVAKNQAARAVYGKLYNGSYLSENQHVTKGFF